MASSAKYLHITNSPFRELIENSVNKNSFSTENEIQRSWIKRLFQCVFILREKLQDDSELEVVAARPLQLDLSP